jgi:hypothetical protein
MIRTYGCQPDWQVKWQAVNGRTATSFCEIRQENKRQVAICLSNVVENGASA